MSLREFAAQLERCAQSDEEALAFVEAFAKVRLKGIILQLLHADPQAAIHRSDDRLQPDWNDPHKLALSGIRPEIVTEHPDPESLYLHIDTATAADRAAIRAYLGMTGLSDKQRRVMFPILCGTRTPAESDELAMEVQRLNGWLDWVRAEGVDPSIFPVYQRHIGIHGASQNRGGQVGAAGAAIAFHDALEDIGPGRIVDCVGGLVPAEVRTPLEVYDWLAGGGKLPKALLLDNGRAIVFSSDPDVAIFQSLGSPYATAAEALAAYDAVRRQPAARRQAIHEFVVGEVKTATDLNNLHERLALGSRETRDEVRTDRFLMMAVLTMDLLRGGSGQRSGRSLENRDVERFSDVFNLYFAWGWDGAREKHPEHWETFKAKLAGWCGFR